MSLPDLEQKQFKVDPSISWNRFPGVLMRAIKEEIGSPFYLYSKGEQLDCDQYEDTDHTTVSDKYEEYQDEDGFWYITYTKYPLMYPTEHPAKYKGRFSDKARLTLSNKAYSEGKIPVICEVMNCPPGTRFVITDGKTAAERKAAWEEIKQRLPRKKTPEDKARRIELFQQMDKNGTDAISFREAYEGCVNILRLDEFTTRLYDIVRRAFNQAKGLGTDDRDAGDDGLVEFLEFRKMLCFIYDYFELTVMFDEIDTDGSMMIDRDEFRAAVPKIEEWGLTMKNPDAIFDQIDTNGSGKMTFDEFCAWAAAMNLDADGEDNVE